MLTMNYKDFTLINKFVRIFMRSGNELWKSISCRAGIISTLIYSSTSTCPCCGKTTCPAGIGASFIVGALVAFLVFLFSSARRRVMALVLAGSFFLVVATGCGGPSRFDEQRAERERITDGSATPGDQFLSSNRNKIVQEGQPADRTGVVILETVERMVDQEELSRVIRSAADRNVRQVALNKLTDQALLSKLALETNDYDVRRLAIAKLSDQSFLAQLAQESKDSDAAQRVISSLTDQTVIARVATEAQDETLRWVAANALNDRALLSKLAVVTKDSAVRNAAIGKLTFDPQFFEELTDPALMAAVVMTTHYWDKNQELIEKISDQALLARIAVESDDDFSRETAAGKLTDQTILAEIGMWINPELTKQVSDQALLARIACEAKSGEVAEIAMDKLTDQALLAHLAVEPKDASIREMAVKKVDDPVLMAKIVLTDQDFSVRAAAAEKINDQDVLAKVAVGDGGPQAREIAVRKLTDQNLLAKIALEEGDDNIRAAAIEGLTDESLLGQMGMWIRPELTKQVTDQGLLVKLAQTAKELEVRKEAVLKLADQDLLAKLVRNDDQEEIRLAAVDRLTDQVLLSKLVEELKNAPEIRKAVVLKLNDQPLLTKIASDDSELSVRLAAISRMDDQQLFRQWAQQNPQAVIRQAVAVRIMDDAFLVDRLPFETSAAVRKTIVETLRTKDALRQVALSAYHADDRDSAAQRLETVSPDTANEVKEVKAELERKVKALDENTSPAELQQLAIGAQFDVLRSTAAGLIKDLATMEAVSIKANDREVLRIILQNLNDKSVLERVSTGADDRAMRLACAQKAGMKTWEEIFKNATAKTATPVDLGDALAAVSLFSSVQSDATEAVQQACLNLIRLGDESRIPEMADLLEDYGDSTLAEDYLNCGQPDLYVAAAAWANRHGFNINTGNGSNRASWGSGR